MSHRLPLLLLLKRYRAIDAADAAQAGRIIEFVTRRPDCFERSCEEGHITGSAWLVDETGTRVLLTHHRKLNKWLQLGGHADGEADALAVAVREAREESGLASVTVESPEIFDVDVHAIPPTPKEPAHWHYDIRFALRARGAEFKVGEESHDLAWVEIARLSDLTTEPSMVRMALKWTRGAVRT